MNGFTRAQKLTITARDLDCVPHGGRCGGELTHHHRKNRGNGGVKSRDRVANGLLVCSAWNSAAESDADLAADARHHGWKLRADHEIETLSVYIPRLHAWVYLDDAGNYLTVDGEPLETKAL